MGERSKELKREIFGNENISIDLKDEGILEKLYENFVAQLEKIAGECASGKRDPAYIYLDIENLSSDFGELIGDIEDNELTNRFWDLHSDLYMLNEEVSESRSWRMREEPKVRAEKRYYTYFIGQLFNLKSQHKKGKIDSDEFLIRLLDLEYEFKHAEDSVGKCPSIDETGKKFYEMLPSMLKSERKYSTNSIKLNALDLIIKHDRSKIPLVCCSCEEKEDYSIEETRYDFKNTFENFKFIVHSYNKKGYPGLDLFVKSMAEAMIVYDVLDPYAYANKQFPLDEKVNKFLAKYMTSCEKLMSEADIESIEEDDFKYCSNPIKKELFEFRLKVYLSALARIDKEPYQLDKVMEEISKLKILPIKKQEKEPVWDYIVSKASVRSDS